MTAPISKTGSWAPPPERTRAEIAADLLESERAAAAIPGLQEKAAQEEKHKKALEEWERPYKQRRAEAIAVARDLSN
jgi:hypothetical protein